ncbi:glycoside hydrolase family 73 protein [Pediococcus acidilactici]|uniref:glycoside hydrolase family 73 protein n=1 Tax=Pediococcus acidilactici TaxID=1254 RepID=UPI000E5C6D35|nr:glycoside hydrolase family 73 protein [Pediococcus acidilactici]RJF46533.1 N-acetylmuramidase [Pediococcus acidilactici]
MAKKKRRRKNNFFYQQGQLKVSSIIGLLLVVCLVVELGMKLRTEATQVTDNLTTTSATAQRHQQFIKTIAPYAQQMQRQYGILPSITMAQAILESDWGQSTLSKKFNNYYGIKGDSDQNSRYFKTQEFVNGKWVRVAARFKVYSSWQESMRDHSLLLVNGTNWNPRQYQAVITASDYKQAAQALYDAQYATDPDYPAKLINLIQKYNLNQYDK